jgi:hypothetical protein
MVREPREQRTIIQNIHLILSIIKLTPDQLSIIEAPQEDIIFLEGAAVAVRLLWV